MSRTRFILALTISLSTLLLAVPLPHRAAAHSTTAPPLAPLADGTWVHPGAHRVPLFRAHRVMAVPPDSVMFVANHLVRNGGDRRRARRVAQAVLRYAHSRHLPVRLVVGVIAVEDNLLNPTAQSHAGARGVMQVMPLHVGNLDRCGQALERAEVNVCYGTRLLREALDATHDLRTALLRYNGCVRTAGCARYATDVLRHARLSPREMRLAVGLPAEPPMVLNVPTPVRDDVAVRSRRPARGGTVATIAAVHRWLTAGGRSRRATRAV
jgi:hypothetical protein